MKVLMVCLGNICRSPLAEGILKKMLSDRNMINWEVDSAGVGDWHTGSPPDHRAIHTAARHGIDISNQLARPFQDSDFNYFDHILAMDEEILDSILSKSRHLPKRQKVSLLLDFQFPGQNRIVPDPYFNGKFEESFQLIYAGCQEFLKKFAPEDKSR